MGQRQVFSLMAPVSGPPSTPPGCSLWLRCPQNLLLDQLGHPYHNAFTVHPCSLFLTFSLIHVCQTPVHSQHTLFPTHPVPCVDWSNERVVAVWLPCMEGNHKVCIKDPLAPTWLLGGQNPLGKKSSYMWIGIWILAGDP